MRRNAREVGFWSVANLAVFAFALIPVLWIISLSLKSNKDFGDHKFLPAHATLTNGFYAQLAASAVLVLCGLLLSQAVKRSQAGAPRGARRGRRERSRSGTALAGGNA